MKSILLTTATLMAAGNNMAMPSSEMTNLDAQQAPKGETVYIKGAEAHTEGQMVKVGETAPEFTGVQKDLSEMKLSNFKEKKVVLNVFPSLDTPTCAASVRHFNADASALENTVVLCISMDLPFAQSRFCTTEGLENVIPVSLFRDEEFAQGYGLRIADGPLKGLMSRAVIIVDEDGKVIYTELVRNVSEEPNYDAALNALK